MPMETDRLRYFIAIAQTESVRKAAELLNVSPSALSKTLRHLEDELEIKLTSPLGRGIVLTPEGRRLAQDAEKIIENLDQLKTTIRSDSEKKKKNPLRIATFEVFSTYFLSSLNDVGYKDRGLVLHEVVPGELERAVEQNQVDLGITYLPLPHPNVEHIKIMSIEMGVYRKKGTFEKLKQQEMPFVVPVLPLSGSPSRVRGLDGWPESAYDRKVLFEVTLMESALELCRQGRCVGYFPLFIIEQHNKKYKEEFNLVRHPSPFPGRKCYSDVYLVKRKDSVEDQNAKLVARLIRTGCK